MITHPHKWKKQVLFQGWICLNSGSSHLIPFSVWKNWNLLLSDLSFGCASSCKQWPSLTLTFLIDDLWAGSCVFLIFRKSACLVRYLSSQVCKDYNISSAYSSESNFLTLIAEYLWRYLVGWGISEARSRRCSPSCLLGQDNPSSQSSPHSLDKGRAVEGHWGSPSPRHSALGMDEGQAPA